MYFMTPRIDIITPCTRAAHLNEAYDSILAQRGVDWRWLIQADRQLEAPLPERIAADPRVAFEHNGASYRAALTRNRALMRGDAPLVFALDDDDLLAPGALARLAAALAEPDAADCYAAWGETHKFTDDGQRHLLKGWAHGGVLPAGTLAGAFQRGEGLHICCGSLLWRREHLVAFGGWAGLLHSEDTNLVIAADALFGSVYVPMAVLEYRTGAVQQVTASEQFRNERTLRHAFARERAAALTRLLGAPTRA